MKISIIGSALDENNEKFSLIVKEIGKILGLKNCIVLTGASLGLPHQILLEAKKWGSIGIGYYPTRNELEIVNFEDLEKIQDFDEVIFIEGFTNRSLEMILNSDAVILLSGRMGTLSEFTIAFEECKPIVVFENTEGISKHFRKIFRFTKKKSKSPIFFGNNPKILLEKLFLYLEK